MKPWFVLLADVQTEMARSAESVGVGGIPSGASGSVSPRQPDAGCDAEEDSLVTEDAQPALGSTPGPQAVVAMVDRLQQLLVHFVIEPPSATALTDLLKASPLATIEPSPGATVLFLIDCNDFGESDVQPRLRACPMSLDMCFKKEAQQHPGSTRR